MEQKIYNCKIILDSEEKTLLCQTKENEKKGGKQSESELEQELIETLKNQGYEYVNIKQEQDLINNLRKQIEKLNAQRTENFSFTDNEWNKFFKENFEGIDNEGVENRTKKIQGNEYKKLLKRENGKELNIDLIDKDNSQNNYLQVINQFKDSENRSRYDVTILVNGLPLVHIELKRRGVDLQDAFNQIERYKERSFSKLFEFIQIFIISNGTLTKYYSNTTRNNKKNSFLFTSYWSYFDNENIKDLREFSKTFLSKTTLLEVLTKYCVLDSESNLKILRPYQIAAVERILERINISINHKTPNEESGGYIWHTTGSGKTLTSFKASQLAHKIKEVKKVLFVVDRKDLYGQTYNEYKNFLGKTGEGTIDNTPDTKTLRNLLNDNEKRIIITTIQKLRRLLSEKNSSLRQEIFNERIVIIMDECHRSQTEEMHQLVKKFKKKNLFGFTGTPLFEIRDQKIEKNITQEIFGKEIHSYKIIDAIADNNVLQFWVDYVVDKEKIGKKFLLSNKNRIQEIVKYIIDDFERKTNPNTMGQHFSEHLKTTKFNSIMATEKIPTAIQYYKEFEKQLKEKNRDLKIAIIYSAYADMKDDQKKETDWEDLPENQKEFLDSAIKKYENQFKCKIVNFNAYRNDVSKRVKEREIDILIVVNMFLTGFDAPKLNTLWVDKNLENHNLIQAFSRTNRNFDKSKPHGNIICFRDLKEAVDLSLSCYALGDKKAFFVENFESRMSRFCRIEEYLLQEYPINREIIGSIKERDFIEKYRELTRLYIGLKADERFKGMKIMDDSQEQDYRGIFLDLYQKYKTNSYTEREKRVNENTEYEEEISFDLELIRSEEIDIDYIIEQISKYSSKEGEREKIIKAVRTNLRLRQEEGIILSYLDRIDSGENLSYKEHKKQMQDIKTNQLIEKYNLQPENTKKFIEKSLERDQIYFGGKEIKENIMPKIDLWKHYKTYKEIWEAVKTEISEIFNIFRIF